MVTWEDSNYGGDSSDVTEGVNGDIDVTKVFVTHKGFLVEKSDGKIFTWDSWKLKF